MTATISDPILKIGAYVRKDTTVYAIVCLERDNDDCVTGRFVLEDIHGVHCSGNTYIHQRITATCETLKASFVLVAEAPSCEVPDYLDADMTRHLATTDL